MTLVGRPGVARLVAQMPQLPPVPTAAEASHNKSRPGASISPTNWHFLTHQHPRIKLEQCLQSRWRRSK
ncbi:hypothetical protein BD779DRAFT_1521989 [Infundibulicybe gibba]|nr:hypothetical protein BD779DRAFT_1521989 [Infundibulicybe gibba]